MAAGHALEHVLEIGEGLDVVELGGGDEGADGRPALGAAVGSGEQVVLAAERDGPDRAFDGVGVELDAAVIEEAAKGVPAAQGIADGIGEAAAGRDLGELLSSQAFIAATSGSDWIGACPAARRPSGRGWRSRSHRARRCAAALRPRQGAGRLMHLIELAPRMRPTAASWILPPAPADRSRDSRRPARCL